MLQYRPPEPDRKVKVMYGRSPNREFEQTYEKLTEGWIPAHPAIVKKLKSSLAEGNYSTEPTQLVKDLKSDPALYLYCLKNIKQLLDQPESSNSPERDIFRISHAKLASLLERSEKEITIQQTRKLTKAQSLRLQHTLISSRTAEAMAEKINLSGDSAFSCAAIRQLGLNLIAWHFPDIYGRALSRQKAGKGVLEEEIERLLGVDPKQIGERIAAEWNLSPEMRHGVNSELDSDEILEQSEEDDKKLSLSEVCNLAELFAKANDTEYYPKAAESWRNNTEKVEHIFGTGLVAQVEVEVLPTLKAYQQFSAKPIEPGLFITPSSDAGTKESRGAKLLINNYFVQRCPEEIRHRFVEVYQEIGDKGISINALRLLVDQVFVTIGFPRGCLYLLQESDMVLKPALRIGDRSLTDYGIFPTYRNNLITASLDSNIPVMQDGLGTDGEIVRQICSALGSNKHQAVLYLEISRDFFDDTPNDPLLFFHAVRQSLIDCLDA